MLPGDSWFHWQLLTLLTLLTMTRCWSMLWNGQLNWWILQLASLLTPACWSMFTGLWVIFLHGILRSTSIWYSLPWHFPKPVKQSGNKLMIIILGVGNFMVVCIWFSCLWTGGSPLLSLVFFLVVYASDLLAWHHWASLYPACHLLVSILMQVCQCNSEVHCLVYSLKLGACVVLLYTWWYSTHEPITLIPAGF